MEAEPGPAGGPDSDHEANLACCQSVTWLSSDGANWSSAYACPTGFNTWRWHTTWHNGMGYSMAYIGRDRLGTLYRTRDGKSWRVLTTECCPDGYGNEAALAFGDDDTAYCLLRSDASTIARLGIGKPPSGSELEKFRQQAYEEAVADGRCEPPWPRWRGWVD